MLPPPQESIFAAVGTSLDPFDRLLRLLDELCAAGQVPWPIAAQAGHCRYAPAHFAAVPFLPAQEIEERVRLSRAIVCHGGAGLLGTCMQLRRRPVVLPRRAAQGEIVNDHQLELCQELARQGHIYLVDDRQGLLRALHQALSGQDPVPASAGGTRLKQAIARLLSDLEARRRGR